MNPPGAFLWSSVLLQEEELERAGEAGARRRTTPGTMPYCGPLPWNLGWLCDLVVTHVLEGMPQHFQACHKQHAIPAGSLKTLSLGGQLPYTQTTDHPETAML